MIIFFICGFISNIAIGYQKNLYSFISGLSSLKFIFAYFCTKLIFSNFSLDDYSLKINKVLKIITIFLVLIGGICNLYNPNRSIDSSYGFSAAIMFFSHPTYLNAFCVMLITLFTYYYKQFKENKKYIIILLILMSLTLRSKAYIFIAIYILFVFYYIFSVGKKKNWFLSRSIILFTVVPIGCFIWKSFYEKFIYFTITYGDTARNVLLNTSIKIAKEYPFGLGFGTFGSAISGEHYSNAYYIYQIYDTYGIRFGDNRFISDTFWPMILGENGVVGMLIFSIIILLFIKQVYEYRNKYNYWFCSLIPIIYLLISSLAESSFANQISVGMFFLIAIINLTSSNLIFKGDINEKR
ncbi:O-antigen ligase family protein [Clostridium perfringens]